MDDIERFEQIKHWAQELDHQLDVVATTYNQERQYALKLEKQNSHYREAIDQIEYRLQVNTLSKYHLHCILGRLCDALEGDSDESS